MIQEWHRKLRSGSTKRRRFTSPSSIEYLTHDYREIYKVASKLLKDAGFNKRLGRKGTSKPMNRDLFFRIVDMILQDLETQLLDGDTVSLGCLGRMHLYRYSDVARIVDGKLVMPTVSYHFTREYGQLMRNTLGWNTNASFIKNSANPCIGMTVIPSRKLMATYKKRIIEGKINPIITGK